MAESTKEEGHTPRGLRGAHPALDVCLHIFGSARHERVELSVEEAQARGCFVCCRLASFADKVQRSLDDVSRCAGGSGVLSIQYIVFLYLFPQ